MKIRTFHNRVDRREYVFDRSDVERALRMLIKSTMLSVGKPAAAAVERWSMEEFDGLNDVVLTQEFEYLGQANEEPVTVDAVDPHVADSGTPTPRV